MLAHRIFMPALLLVLAPTAFAYSDGCVVRRGGHYVREAEQRAFIEWADGRETLFVATKTEATDEATLWLLPVPGSPSQVKATPVASYPRVTDAAPITARAREAVLRARVYIFALDIGCFCVLFGCSGKATQGGDVIVHERIECLGMVVETLTAKSTDALDGYLTSHALDVRAANLTSLAPYLQQDYTLVCAWRSGATAEGKARALRIEFPTPHVYFPLRPSRVYTDQVATAIFVRGWFQPTDKSNTLDVRCRYLRGRVELDQPGEAPSPQERLTQVLLSQKTSAWTEDLTMTEGAPTGATTAESIMDAMNAGIWLGPTALVGMSVGLFLPLLLLPANHRSRWSYGVGALAGASVVFSSLMMILILVTWFRCSQGRIRFPDARDGWALWSVQTACVIMLTLYVHMIICMILLTPLDIILSRL
jgi:hypothetical protein